METATNKPDHELAAEEFAAAIKSLNLQFECKPISRRTGPGNEAWNDKAMKDSRHYHCVISWPGTKHFIESDYSCGSLACLPKTDSEAMKLWQKVPFNAKHVQACGPITAQDIKGALAVARGFRGSSTILQAAVLDALRNLYQPSLADVLSSLLQDAVDPANSFEEWASDFGYDTDSRSAHATWNICCETYRKLVRAFGREEMERLQEIVRRF